MDTIIGVVSIFVILILAYVFFKYLHIVIGVAIVAWILSVIFGSILNAILVTLAFCAIGKFISYLSYSGKGRKIWNTLTLKKTIKKD